MTATLVAPPTRLTGDELLAKVEELKGQPKSVLVRECGYLGIRKVKLNDGSFEERPSLNFSAFQDALLAAKGIDLTPDFPGGDSVGRGSRPSFRARVMKKGMLVVGASYTAMGEFAPGTEFFIEVGENAIMLVRVGEDGEPEEPVFPD